MKSCFIRRSVLKVWSTTAKKAHRGIKCTTVCCQMSNTTAELNFIYIPHQPGPEELVVHSCLQAGEVAHGCSLASDYGTVNYNNTNRWTDLTATTDYLI